MRPGIAILLFLAPLLSGCTTPPEPADGSGTDEIVALPVTGCGSFGAPGQAIYAPGCYVPLGEHDLVDEPEVRFQGVPINSTGLYIWFHVGPAVGRATVTIDAGDHTWTYEFDGHTGLTSRLETGSDPSSDLTWFYAEVGSVCEITAFDVRAQFTGHYTTLRVEPHALDPQFDYAGPPLEPAARASCNGFWSGNSTTPLP